MAGTVDTDVWFKISLHAEPYTDLDMLTTTTVCAVHQHHGMECSATSCQLSSDFVKHEIPNAQINISCIRQLVKVTSELQGQRFEASPRLTPIHGVENASLVTR
jgi:hypothetical protein